MAGASFERDLDYIEYFSGRAVLAKSVTAAGFRVATYDKKHCCLWEDLNTDEGASTCFYKMVLSPVLCDSKGPNRDPQ
jgi:hypothetical protein